MENQRCQQKLIDLQLSFEKLNHQSQLLTEENVILERRTREEMKDKALFEEEKRSHIEEIKKLANSNDALAE